MESLANLSIKALQHVGIPVTNLKTSEAFYNKLGFAIAMDAPFDHEGEHGHCIMMKRGTIVLELYQMPEKLISEIKNRKDGHIDHIAFDVENIDEAFSILRENGFQMVETSPVFLKFWSDGCKYFNVIGPDGERLEFNQIL